MRLTIQKGIDTGDHSRRSCYSLPKPAPKLTHARDMQEPA